MRVPFGQPTKNQIYVHSLLLEDNSYNGYNAEVHSITDVSVVLVTQQENVDSISLTSPVLSTSKAIVVETAEIEMAGLRKKVLPNLVHTNGSVTTSKIVERANGVNRFVVKEETGSEVGVPKIVMRSFMEP